MAKVANTPQAPATTEETKSDAVKRQTGAVTEAPAWDNIQGEESSGRGDVLEMTTGQVAGPFTITRIQPGVFLTDEPDAKPVTAYSAKDKEGVPYRLPVGAIFKDKMEELRVTEGCVIFIRRGDDILKKKGRGKNRPMANYDIKLVSRPKV